MPNPLVDERGQFPPVWKKLIEDFPDRFLAGLDVNGRPGAVRGYDKRVKKLRRALGGLNPDAARMVATENFHRILGKSR